jgi:hypothetical protein
MSDTDRQPETRTSGTGEIPADSIREALEQVLASAEFRASRRCQEFLRFVVDTTLAGNAQVLKERTIGVEVFGRAASYDPGNDSTVRVKAGEVRKRLHMYYTGPGAANPVRIELPAGGYVPEFHRAPVPPPDQAVAAAPAAPAGHVWLWPAVALCALLAIALGAIFISTRAPAKTDPMLRQFWGPALDSSNAVLFCVSYVPVYGLDPAVETGGQGPRRIEDFTLLPENYVGGGDVQAVSLLSRLFAGMNHDYRTKLGSDVSFHDLSSSPAVLIGYSYTRWSTLLRGFRYLFDTNPQTPRVTDNGKPTVWALPPIPRNRRTDEDYALVCRIFHPDTGTLVVLLSGITDYGTEAAADLVCSPSRLAAAVKGLPPDWPKRNLQLVIHARVISGEAAMPRVVASYVW